MNAKALTGATLVVVTSFWIGTETAYNQGRHDGMVELRGTTMFIGDIQTDPNGSPEDILNRALDTNTDTLLRTEGELFRSHERLKLYEVVDEWDYTHNPSKWIEGY